MCMEIDFFRPKKVSSIIKDLNERNKEIEISKKKK